MAALNIYTVLAFGMENIEIRFDSVFIAQRQNLVNMLFPLVGCYQTLEDFSQEAYIKITELQNSRSTCHASLLTRANKNPQARSALPLY